MDESLLLAMNLGWAHPYLDLFFVWLSSRFGLAAPLVAVLLILFVWRWRVDGVKLWLLLALVVGGGDQLGLTLKHVFKQPRPCFDMAEHVRQPDHVLAEGCRDSHAGLPSNHTLDFFSAAAFLTVVFGRRAAPLFALALMVGISRIYLAMHYPSQVAVGASLGALWGWLGARLGMQYLPFMRRWRA